jgi:hypothetical protein
MIGFSVYDMYNSVHNLKAAQALVAEAKNNANIVVVSMHVGAEGTGALHVKDETEFFYGENRGNAIKFARTMIDTGADLVLGQRYTETSFLTTKLSVVMTATSFLTTELSVVTTATSFLTIACCEIAIAEIR